MDDKAMSRDNRLHYLKTLNSFISTSKSELNKCLNIFGWTEELTVKNDNLVHCPFEESHRVPEDRLNVHLESCPNCPSGKGSDVGSVDKEYSGTTEPKLPADSAESLMLNEFLLPYDMNNEKSAPKTQQEILQAERDAKRRRIRYRTCKVHTKSKSHCEILRGVISSQMQALEDWIKQEKGIEDDNEENPGTIHSPTVETKKDNNDMIWLDWNFKGNPHTRWKSLHNDEGVKNYNADESTDLKTNRRSNHRYGSSSYGRSQENDRQDSRYDYDRNKKSRNESYDRDDKWRRDHRRRSPVRYYEREDRSRDTNCEKRLKYTDKYDSKRGYYEHRRHVDDSKERVFEKPAKYRDESENRRSRSNEKQSVKSRKKKSHSRKKKKHKHSRQSSGSNSDSN